ncbi:HNH endonuclease, partial [Listeria monocytogenes]|nr:HNH endonuclease [Listeria monocytogenes]EFR8998772.1 HNH endonuclease [Listeria monocytogenes]EHR5858889.1 HNH endonuclease [Listeria monocytogenes]
MLTQAECHTFYKSKAWVSIRKEVLKRDNYECQECKRQGKVFTDYH